MSVMVGDKGIPAVSPPPDAVTATNVREVRRIFERKAKLPTKLPMVETAYSVPALLPTSERVLVAR